MSSTALFRLSSVAGVLSGLVLAAAAVFGCIGPWLYAQILTTIFAFLFLCFLPTWHLTQRAKSGAWGGVSLTVIFVGFLLVGLNYYTLCVGVHFLDRAALIKVWGTYFGKAWRIGEVTSLLGVVAFCYAAFRAAILPRLATALFAVGYAVAVLLHLIDANVLFIWSCIGNLSAGAGITWLGYAVWSLQRKRVEPSAPPL